jgi:hypothetical protein
MKLSDEHAWDTTQSEPTHRQRRAVNDPVDGLGRADNDFVQNFAFWLVWEACKLPRGLSRGSFGVIFAESGLADMIVTHTPRRAFAFA